MKVLHLFVWDKKFVLPFIKLINDNFRFERHEFIVFGKVDEDILPPDTAVYRSPLKKCLSLSRSMYSADKIILHGLFNINLLHILTLQPWLLKKCNWVIWGGDLYTYNSSRKNWCYYKDEFFRRFVIRRIGGLITYIPGDVDLARKWYGAKGKHIECIMYQSNVFIPQPVKEKKSNLKTILVGNSATPSNNHEFVFAKLAEQDLEGWRIVVPLSYGENAYAEKIIKFGEELFGDRFEPLTEFLPYEDYLQLLSDVDIAVFAHDRQQAMGNTITLLGMGKTVYMKHNTTQAVFLKNQNIRLGDVDNLGLSTIAEYELKVNAEIVLNYFSQKRLLSQLKLLFRG